MSEILLVDPGVVDWGGGGVCVCCTQTYGTLCHLHYVLLAICNMHLEKCCIKRGCMSREKPGLSENPS